MQQRMQDGTISKKHTTAKEQQNHLNDIYINVFNFKNLPLGCNFYRFINDYTYLFHFISISRIPSFLILGVGLTIGLCGPNLVCACLLM